MEVFELLQCIITEKQSNQIDILCRNKEKGPRLKDRLG